MARSKRESCHDQGDATGITAFLKAGGALDKARLTPRDLLVQFMY
jgi:hypothetical protein